MSKLLLCLLLWLGSWALFLSTQTLSAPQHWLMASALSSLALVAALLYREHHQKQQQALRISKVEAAALRAQMNPHFIFNALNAIQHFVIAEDKHNAAQFLSRFSKLVRSTLQRSTKDAISLEEEIEALEQYLQLEQLRFPNCFDYTISVAPSINRFDTLIPPLLLQPFVENAILHGLSKKEGLGKIAIGFDTSIEGLLISIRDNGIGFHQSQLLKSRVSSKHKSLGLKICENRLALYNGQSDNQIDVKELKSVDGQVLGTLVQLSLRA